ncbi:MAG: hypothetical protein ABJ024_08250, partial [Lentilitoribacter sp.]
GIPSSANRAPTSAIRVAPLVITIKLTINNTQKTTSPRNTLPPITNWANPSMTSPAASVPVCPWPIINFVDETLSDNRNIKEARRIVGNAEKSRGRSINSVTVKIKIAYAKEAAKPTSNTHAGIGKIIMTITAINATANMIVGLNKAFTVKFCTSYFSKSNEN